MANAAPTATGVTITGTPAVGQVLTGNYAYGDVDGDAEGTSTFPWLRGGVPIGGATAITYTTVAADSGQSLTFEVTLMSATGTVTGVAAISAAVVVAPNHSATRTRPTCYVAGTAFMVTLNIAPAPSVLEHAAEEQPPAGWTRGLISDGGAWDTTTLRAK